MKPEHFWNGKLSRDECVYQISGMPPLKVKKCFAEKQGVRIHPMEIRGGELGDRRTIEHIPMWRKKEIAAQKREEERLKKLAETNASANNAPKPPQTTGTTQSATAPQTTGTQQQQYVAPPTAPTVPQGTQEQAQTQQTQQAKTPNEKPVVKSAEQEATATAPAPQTQQKPTSSYKEIVSADVL